MRNFISFVVLSTIKFFANLFYRFEAKWLGREVSNWDSIRLIVFLGHTSLYEPLFIGLLPWKFVKKLSRKLVAPGASKTMQRPIVGKFWKLMSPGMTSISRKRDKSWREFMQKISDDSVIIIAPEGRMKRKNGLDVNGQKMTVKSGISDILEFENEGDMLIAYSGGLHHIQAPGEKFPKLFKKIKANLEVISIKEYKTKFDSEGIQWKKDVTSDFQNRLEKNCP